MAIKRIFIILLICLFTVPGFAKTKNFSCTDFTGGGDGDLDKINGQDLNDGDFAVVKVAKFVNHYVLDADLGATESEYGVITPDSNAGDKCWVLVDGMLDYSYSDTSTSGTGEDNLKSYTLPAGMFAPGKTLRVTAAGTKTAANGNKTLKFYFGASSVTFHAAANNTNDWKFEAVIYSLSSSTQRVSWTGWDGATMLQGYEAFSIDTTSTTAVKITGECADASDTITQTMWQLKIE
jgi:hypothetical protein